MSTKIIEREVTETTCDNCGLKVMSNEIGAFIPVTVDFGYPNEFDTERKDFCSDSCLKCWVNTNIR